MRFFVVVWAYSYKTNNKTSLTTNRMTFQWAHESAQRKSVPVLWKWAKRTATRTYLRPNTGNHRQLKNWPEHRWAALPSTWGAWNDDFRCGFKNAPLLSLFCEKSARRTFSNADFSASDPNSKHVIKKISHWGTARCLTLICWWYICHAMRTWRAHHFPGFWATYKHVSVQGIDLITKRFRANEWKLVQASCLKQTLLYFLPPEQLSAHEGWRVLHNPWQGEVGTWWLFANWDTREGSCIQNCFWFEQNYSGPAQTSAKTTNEHKQPSYGARSVWRRVSFFMHRRRHHSRRIRDVHFRLERPVVCVVHEVVMRLWMYQHLAVRNGLNPTLP